MLYLQRNGFKQTWKHKSPSKGKPLNSSVQHLHLCTPCIFVCTHTDEKASEVIQMYIYVPFYAYTFVKAIHLRERGRKKKTVASNAVFRLHSTFPPHCKMP